MTMIRSVCVSFLLVLLALPAAAQQDPDTIGTRLMADATIKSALESIRAAEPQTIDTQISLCEVEAPPFKETKRGEITRGPRGGPPERADRRPATIGDAPRAPRPHRRSPRTRHRLPEGTNASQAEGNMSHSGIGDDCRGLAARSRWCGRCSGKIQTPGITFVGTVGEEGLGDLRGVKQLFDDTLKGTIDRFVSIDGAGLGITTAAVGSLRYRVTFKGPGGHSFGAFGLSNPIHALGRAMSAIADFQVPSDPKTTFNVGRIGGGTSVNSIPFEAWMEVDMRSTDPRR
jgi:hypothetical protein